MHTRGALTVLVLGGLLGARAAQAQSGACTPITALPTTITAAGVYCLTANLTYNVPSSTAITVNHDAVVIDLNKFRLRYTPATPSSTGVEVTAGNINVTIRNGLISDFGTAIRTYGLGTTVEDLRVSKNAVVVEDAADGAVIRRCHFRDTNLIVESNSARILDNDFYGPSSFPFMSAVSLWGADNAFVVGNRIGRYQMGVEFAQFSTGKYRDNLTTNVTTPYTGAGTDAGNNN
jgi:hypothetical protein